MADFSVLLPVYAGDRAGWVERAIRSVTVDQSRRPAELVIVQDGPVGADQHHRAVGIGQAQHQHLAGEGADAARGQVHHRQHLPADQPFG